MNYETIKRNYDRGLWNAAMVNMAVQKGVITAEQAAQIIGDTEPEPGGDTIATADLDAAYREGVNSYE